MPIYVGKILTAAGILAICAYVWLASAEFPANGHQVPQFTASVAVILALMLILDAYRTRDSKNVIIFNITYEKNKQYIILLLSIFYIYSIFSVGYFVSSFFLIVFGSLIVGVRSVKPIAVTVIISLPLMYMFFEIFLNARLPRGFLI